MNRRITIYSGQIPSTRFIERLINGISATNFSVYLFGTQKEKTSYSGKVIVKSNLDSRFSRLLLLMKYSVLLFIFRRKDKRKIDQYIQLQTKNRLLRKVKYYPILWHKPAVFHLQWAKSTSEWMWVQDFGIKIIVSLRGAHINYSPLVDKELAEQYKMVFSKVDGFHAVSKAIAREAAKYGANPEKIKVVYSGLPESRKIPQNYSSEKGKDPFKMLSVGRSHWVKGYNYVLDTCHRLKQSGFNFHYTIVGANNVEELEYQRNILGLADLVTFTTNIPSNQVTELMQECDLLLLPSVDEGIANVVLEAMQLKKMVLTTNCGGMEEVIQDGTNGFVVPIRDSEAMSEKIMEIASLSQDEVLRITSNAFKTIEGQHSEEKMVNDMLALYNAVLQNTSIS